MPKIPLFAYPRHSAARKRQPNLLFAAGRYPLGGPAGSGRLRTGQPERAELAVVMLEQRTTNEPTRSATLLPAVTQLPPSLAVIEVGASAVTCTDLPALAAQAPQPRPWSCIIPPPWPTSRPSADGGLPPPLAG